MNVDMAMKKIAEQLADFVEKIVKEMGLDYNFAYRMDLDGRFYYYYLYNKTTHSVAGKMLSYRDLAIMCQQKKAEFEFNKMTREMIAKTSNTFKPVPEGKGSTFQINPKDVIWV